MSGRDFPREAIAQEMCPTIAHNPVTIPELLAVESGTPSKMSQPNNGLMAELNRTHKRILLAMLRNDGTAIASTDELARGPMQDLLELKLLQVFQIGRINEISVDLCLTVEGWKVAQKLRRETHGDGDGPSA
jgi:hypothetical protein